VTGDALPKQLAEWLSWLFAKTASGAIAPHIGGRFQLAEAAQATVPCTAERTSAR
jgi:NADPH:quinone reductase-like Zn-dependent oxidoreductase